MFADGKTKAPRFAEALRLAMGEPLAEPDLAEQAESALRLIRQGQERLARVVERMRHADEDDADRTRAELIALTQRAAAAHQQPSSAPVRRQRKG